MMSKKQRDNPNYGWVILVVIAIIVLALIYVASLGRIDLRKKKERLDTEYRRRNGLLEKRVKLKKRLSRIFKISFFSFRLVIVVIYFWGNIYLYYYVFNEDIQPLLSWNEAALLSLLAIIYLASGSIRNFSQVMRGIKESVKSGIYGRYVDIDDKIEQDTSELQRIEEERNELEDM